MYFSRIRIQPKVYRETQFPKVLSDNDYAIHRLLWDLFPGQKQRNFLYREEIAKEQLGYHDSARGESIYYLVSPSAPASQNLFFTVETRLYKPKLLPGECLRFALRANPVVTKNSRKHDIVMNVQKTFLSSLCEVLGLQSKLSLNAEKKEYKSVLVSHGGQALDNRLTTFLKKNCRYAERLDQTLSLSDKLAWALKASVDRALDEWIEKKGNLNGFAIAKDNWGELKLQNSAYQWHALTGKGAKGEKAGFSSVDFEGELEITDVETFTKALYSGIGRSKAFGCGLMLVKRIRATQP